VCGGIAVRPPLFSYVNFQYKAQCFGAVPHLHSRSLRCKPFSQVDHRFLRLTYALDVVVPQVSFEFLSHTCLTLHPDPSPGVYYILGVEWEIQN